jgi:hypothetical protein
MLQPNGGGIYVGVSKEHDRSMPSTSAAQPTPSTGSGPDDLDSDDEDVDMPHEEMPTVTLEDLLPEPEDSDSEDDDVEEPLPESGPISVVSSRDWLSYPVEGGRSKHLHKTSILRSLFNPDFDHLSVSRLLRVRGYTKDGGRKPNLNHQEFTGEHSFNIGDLAVGLIRSGDTVGAALINVTALVKDKVRFSQVDTEDIGCPNSKIMVSAQLLILRDVFVVGDGDSIPSTRKWLWNGDYAKFDPLKGPASITEGGTQKSLVVKIPGAFVHPVDAEIESVKHLFSSDRGSVDEKKFEHTWAISDDDMQGITDTMYGPSDAATVLIALPKLGKCTSFPYTDSKGACSHF